MEKRAFYTIPQLLNIKSIYTAFDASREKDYSFSGEMHDFWEMVYIKNGNALVAKDRDIYRLERGDIVFHKPMEFHRIMSDGEKFEFIVISFISDSEILYNLSENVIKINKDNENRLQLILKEIYTSFTIEGVAVKDCKKNEISAQLTLLKFEAFLLELLGNESNFAKYVKTRGSKTFSKIIDVMQNNLRTDLSVTEIAEKCSMSESNLKKIIRKYTGTGVIKHFTRLRIAYATSLLESGMNVSEVSNVMGFSSPSYFSYVFKRETGVTPISCKS